MRALKRPESKQVDPTHWIPVIRDRIVAGWHPSRVILFGSQARGEASWDSDIDLLVVLAEEGDKRQVALDIRKALADLPVSKDILVATPTEIERRGRVLGTILSIALREGRVIYDMSEAEQKAEAMRWLNRAGQDLADAETLLDRPAGVPHNALWHAEQAAEKALKAALIFLGIEPPRTHNLDELHQRLPEAWRVNVAAPELENLGKRAVESRYPGDWEDPDIDEARQAVSRARQVLRDIQDHFQKQGLEGG